MQMDRTSKLTLPRVGDKKEWEEARCPVCMESPHNAVLLLCSSHEKGCRPYMCDTSHQLSNCLDQFRKSSSASVVNEDGVSLLICPLCRGHISGSIVNKPARKFMNSKRRSCSLETCDFGGNYSELRKHALRANSSVRPAEADPIRQQEWETMVQQNELNDLQFVNGFSGGDFSSLFVPTVSFSGSVLDNFFRHGDVLGSTSTEELDNIIVEIQYYIDRPAEDPEWDLQFVNGWNGGDLSSSFATIVLSI